MNASLSNLAAPGTPEFMVVWEALHQFLDNSDPEEGTEYAEADLAVLLPKREAAQRVVEAMEAKFVAAMEAVATR